MVEKYESPKIEDHGDLAELTAGKTHGKFLDATFPENTPIEEVTLTSVPHATP